ncbi:hypothetical protein [Actinopolyspora mortivallis]|uniref:hypothetical protein n=1 Tax=Actinopolyspora mortivallis TaxID=33906 RepID=UPI00036332D4|nr:hypothetical protein [Actinopolyspora mortivallis]
MADHRDPSESSEDPRRTPPPATNQPEVVDAEVVPDPAEHGTPPPTTRPPGDRDGPPSGSDEEAFREYQQFLEFRRFQEWQRRYGEVSPGGDGTGGHSRQRPWYRRVLRVLRFRFVRRLLYLLVLVLVLTYLYHGMFGGGGRQAPPGASGGGSGQRGSAVLQTSPRGAVVAVYDLLAGDSPTDVCLLFTPSAAEQFARVHEARDCAGAARKLHGRITDRYAYKNPDLARDAARIVGDRASLSSCALRVSGGPRLGEFGMSRQPSGGWKIDGYTSADCD